MPNSRHTRRRLTKRPTARKTPWRAFASRPDRSAQRRRLKLSAQEFAKLVGVSAQTIYHWEQGKGRPRAAQFAALTSLRGIGLREARSRLEGD